MSEALNAIQSFKQDLETHLVSLHRRNDVLQRLYQKKKDEGMMSPDEIIHMYQVQLASVNDMIENKEKHSNGLYTELLQKIDPSFLNDTIERKEEIMTDLYTSLLEKYAEAIKEMKPSISELDLVLNDDLYMDCLLE